MHIPNVKLLVGRGTLLAKKHSPVILTTAGIIGGLTTVVLASKATLKLEPIVEETSEKLDILNENKLLEVNGSPVWDSSDINKEKAKVYTRAALEVFKLYSPAISVGLVSVTCIVGAQGIMQRRNAAVVAAYSALDRGFAEYRKRVTDEIGEDKERELRNDVTTERKVNPETGKLEDYTVVRPNEHSVYARFFDETNPEWKKGHHESNLYFLVCQQNYMNDLLQYRGHVFLNEVYDRLGLERTPAGQIVGWVKGANGADGYIDFGIHDPKNERAREFVNGYESGILLDFNVDGVVYDLI